MKVLIAALALGVSLTGSTQHVVRLLSVPTNTPPEEDIYLASSANSWNPGDPAWVFEDGFLTLPESVPPTFQGKFTRGSWETVEGNASGGFLPNRTFDFTGTDTIEVSILSWEGQGVFDDLPENLILFDPAFPIPSLDRTRRIRVLLPPDYHDSELHYPVLYMHDGQNLFSAQEAFSGEWKVDEAMDDFHTEGYPGAIIVAIDNGGAHRIGEYTPFAHPEHGGGDGEAYVDFIADYLKPAIDDSLRTLPGREHTGIMGSSLGGLISFYAGMARPEIFSKVGALSPSFWFSDSIYDYAAETGFSLPAMNYFLAGGLEGQSVFDNAQNMVDLMIDAGFSPEWLRLEFDPQGAHNELFWSQRFPEAFRWLFIDEPLPTDDPRVFDEPVLFPNPATDTVQITLPRGDAVRSVRIFDLRGVLVLSAAKDHCIDVSSLADGAYRVVVTSHSAEYQTTLVKR